MAMSVGIMKRNLRIMSRHMLPESISLAAYGQSSPRSIRRISDPAEGNSAADHFARLTETPTVPCEESSRWRSRVRLRSVESHTRAPGQGSVGDAIGAQITVAPTDPRLSASIRSRVTNNPTRSLSIVERYTRQVNEVRPAAVKNSNDRAIAKERGG